MDVLGFLGQHGFSGLNSLLIVALAIILKGRFATMEKKVEEVWRWYLKQQGAEEVRRHEKGD